MQYNSFTQQDDSAPDMPSLSILQPCVDDVFFNVYDMRQAIAGTLDVYIRVTEYNHEECYRKLLLLQDAVTGFFLGELMYVLAFTDWDHFSFQGTVIANSNMYANDDITARLMLFGSGIIARVGFSCYPYADIYTIIKVNGNVFSPGEYYGYFIAKKCKTFFETSLKSLEIAVMNHNAKRCNVISVDVTNISL